MTEIPELPILQFLAMLERGEITHCYNTGTGLQCLQPQNVCTGSGFPHSITNAMPYGSQYSEKSKKLKIKSMVNRGLIDGCLCGCRGDFELTDLGRRTLEGAV